MDGGGGGGCASSYFPISSFFFGEGIYSHKTDRVVMSLELICAKTQATKQISNEKLGVPCDLINPSCPRVMGTIPFGLSIHGFPGFLKTRSGGFASLNQ